VACHNPPIIGVFAPFETGYSLLYIGATSLGLLASELAWDAVLSIYQE
jgi:hypothetical protein